MDDKNRVATSDQCLVTETVRNLLLSSLNNAELINLRQLERVLSEEVLEVLWALNESDEGVDLEEAVEAIVDHLHEE